MDAVHGQLTLSSQHVLLLLQSTLPAAADPSKRVAGAPVVAAVGPSCMSSQSQTCVVVLLIIAACSSFLLDLLLQVNLLQEKSIHAKEANKVDNQGHDPHHSPSTFPVLTKQCGSDELHDHRSSCAHAIKQRLAHCSILSSKRQASIR